MNNGLCLENYQCLCHKTNDVKNKFVVIRQELRPVLFVFIYQMLSVVLYVFNLSFKCTIRSTLHNSANIESRSAWKLNTRTFIIASHSYIKYISYKNYQSDLVKYWVFLKGLFGLVNYLFQCLSNNLGFLIYF